MTIEMLRHLGETCEKYQREVQFVNEWYNVLKITLLWQHMLPQSTNRIFLSTQSGINNLSCFMFHFQHSQQGIAGKQQESEIDDFILGKYIMTCSLRKQSLQIGKQHQEYPISTVSEGFIKSIMSILSTFNWVYEQQKDR